MVNIVLNIEVTPRDIRREVNGILYSIGLTDTWLYELEDMYGKLPVDIHKISIPLKAHKQLRREQTLVYTEMPSIQNIYAEGIIGTVTGCRVNGGGCNRALVTTQTNTYIIGSNEILKRNANGKWYKEKLTLPQDIKFCTGLDTEGYDYYNRQYFTVHGCGMEQVYIEIIEDE